MKIAYKIALLCGLAPLIIAVIILMGWFLTDAEEFLIAGIFNILGGLVLFFIGISCLIVYEYQHRQQYQHSAWKKLLKPFLVLLSNFPAAAACIYAVLFMQTISQLVIVNQTQEVIPVIHLTSELSKTFGVKHLKGVMPNDVTKKLFRFKHSGSIEYSFELNGRLHEGTLVGYISRQHGKNVVMTISNNGEVSVEEENRLRFF